MDTGLKNRRSRKRRCRLTRPGWLFLTVAVLVGLAASQSQAAAFTYVIFGVMIAALLASLVLARRIVSAVTVRRDVPERVWQNQTVHLAYHLRNVRRRGACLALSVEEVCPDELHSAAGFCVHVPPRAVFRAGARFVARKRGRIQLSAVNISTGFPFGLITASRTVAVPASLVVWPALGKLKRRLLAGGAVEISSAPPSGASGGQDEFFGLREYRPGDSPRWIHWRRSAGKATPVVREMARALPEVLWVVLDTFMPRRSGAAERRRERMLRFAATLIDHALSRGYLVALALAYGDGARTLAPAEGRGQRSALLDALADVDANTRTRLDETIGSLPRDQLRQGQVVVVAPSAKGLATAPLGALRAACRSVTVVTDRELPLVFEDDPLARQAEAQEQIHAA